ncbi:MAG: hypothetical protein JWQ07_455 [Ramlibacter sp.]|nr:hypothetical protein [Ramlibacter sp.]
MTQPTPELMSRPCGDIPEFLRFVQQDYRKQALLEQTGGGDAFVEAAGRVVRKNVLQALPYASPSSRYVQELRRNGIADEVLDRALARAWLDASDEFLLPRPRKRDRFYGTVALLGYSIVIVVAGLISMVMYLRHAHPDWAEMLLAVPPLLAICGLPIVLVLFLALRKLVHGG